MSSSCEFTLPRGSVKIHDGGTYRVEWSVGRTKKRATLYVPEHSDQLVVENIYSARFEQIGAPDVETDSEVTYDDLPEGLAYALEGAHRSHATPTVSTSVEVSDA